MALVVAVILLLPLWLCLIGLTSDLKFSSWDSETNSERVLFWIMLLCLPPALHAGLHVSGLLDRRGK